MVDEEKTQATENAEEKAQKEKPKQMPGLTPEQKEAMNVVKNSVSRFNQVVSFYLFNQVQMIEDGEVHIHLTVKKHQIEDIELSSRLARNLINGKKD